MYTVLSENTVDLVKVVIMAIANDSSTIQYVLNNDSNWANNDSSQVDYSGIARCVVSMLGLPGNLLVAVVYTMSMTTSMRVYMFSLAVADSAVCIGGIIQILVSTGYAASLVVINVIRQSVYFTVCLLVFISIERLIAVRWPHSFNVDARRAKTAVIILFFIAGIFLTVKEVAKYMEHDRIDEIMQISLITVSLSIMIISSSLIGVSLVKRSRLFRNQIGVETATQSLPSAQGTSSGTKKLTPNYAPDGAPHSIASHPATRSIDVTADTRVQFDASASTEATATSKVTAKQVRSFKNVFVLFLVTVVFMVSWLPNCLSILGVPVLQEVVRTFVTLNSAANPLIYGVASAMFREDVRRFSRRLRSKLPAYRH